LRAANLNTKLDLEAQQRRDKKAQRAPEQARGARSLVVTSNRAKPYLDAKPD